MLSRFPLRIGTAGWAIPREHAGAFPAEGSTLQRYAARLNCAEINSSFHRPHRPATYARWAASVPDDFRFAAKLPKTITHTKRLVGAEPELDRFLREIFTLGPKLGPLLVQLPPSLAFDAGVAASFFDSLHERARASVGGEIAMACEPRHATWFTDEAETLLRDQKVARVAADPPRVPEAADADGLPKPGGWPGLIYYRLHGSPVMYRSSYEPAFLAALAARLRGHSEEAPSTTGRHPEELRSRVSKETWCIFDNTTLGAAAGNALEARYHPDPKSGASMQSPVDSRTFQKEPSR